MMTPHKKHSLERFPSAPIIREGFPKNQSAVENSTVVFECPLISDLGAHVQWTKITNNGTVSKLEVSFTRSLGDGKKLLPISRFCFIFLLFVDLSRVVLSFR